MSNCVCVPIGSVDAFLFTRHFSGQNSPAAKCTLTVNGSKNKLFCLGLKKVIIFAVFICVVKVTKLSRSF